MINGANAILYSDYSNVAALQAEGIEIARPISDQSWGLLAAITLPAGLRSASPAPPPDRGPADLSPSAARQENWRTLASSPGHRPATLPLWLGGHDFSRPNRRPSGMGEGASRGRRVRVERDCTSPSPAQSRSGRRLR
jgi:hypothetical protein